MTTNPMAVPEGAMRLDHIVQHGRNFYLYFESTAPFYHKGFYTVIGDARLEYGKLVWNDDKSAFYFRFKTEYEAVAIEYVLRYS